MSPAACGDLITAVFDFAHDMCALKLSEHQLALFSALVLINTGKVTCGTTVKCVDFPLTRLVEPEEAALVVLPYACVCLCKHSSSNIC